MKTQRILSGVCLFLCLGLSTIAGDARLQVRDLLVGDRIYYVRMDGDDSNAGLINDAAGAFRTIQKAVDVVVNDLDLGGYNLKIQVADGTYDTPVVLRRAAGNGAVSLVGNLATPANVTIGTSAAGAHCVLAVNDAVWVLKGFRLSAVGSGASGICAATGAKIRYEQIEFGTCSGAHVASGTGATVDIGGSSTISGGASCHWSASDGGRIRRVASVVVTLIGTPAFALRFADATQLGALNVSGVSFVGTAAGMRYLAAANGVIYTGSGGANFFPGSIAGSCSSGGQYRMALS